MATPNTRRVMKSIMVALVGVIVFSLPPSADARQDSSVVKESTTMEELIVRMEEKSDSLNDYQAVFKARIVKGKKQAKFDGNFYFKRPRQIRIDKGGRGGVVFKKNGKIRGWILSRLFSHGHDPDDEALNDPRGKRIDHYIFDDVIAELKTFLQEGAQASLETDSLSGKNMLRLEIILSGATPPFSRRQYWIDPAILLPVGYETFEESLLVEEIFFLNLKLNPGLKDDLF